MPTGIEMDGSVELALVEGYDPKTYKGTVRSISTGARQTCIFNPSPYMGIMPDVNTIVLTYKKQGYHNRYLVPLSELLTEDKRSLSQQLEDGEEKKSQVMRELEPGDCYFGRFARLFMDSAGNASLYSKGGNLFLSLNHSTSKAELGANNFSFYTPGYGIRMHTASSVPTTFGDSLRIEKNIPVVPIPEEILPVQLPAPTISFMEMDSTGGITLSSAAGAASLELSAASLLAPGTPGQITLKNSIAKLDIDPLGTVLMGNAVASLEMTPIGDVSIESASAALKITAASQALVSSAMTEVRGTSDLLLLSLAQANLQAPAISLTGNVSASATLSVAGASTIGGALNVIGATTLDGALFVNGLPSFVGAPATVPLIGVTTVAKIPVLVNGTLAGFIPVIP